VRSSSLTYVPQFDGLRAFAVMMVVVSHLVAVGELGSFGVTVFFVLSGHLITTLLLQERDRLGHVRLGRFYARRALRLYPALLATAFVCTLAYPLFRLGSFEAVKAAGIAMLYLTNVAETLDVSTWWLQHTWSLALEEQYYLVWPLLLGWLLTWGMRAAARVALLGAMVSGLFWFTIGADSHAQSFNPVGHADGLLLGSAAALLLHAGMWRPSRMLATGCGAGLLLLCAAQTVVATPPWDRLAVACLAVPLIAATSLGDGPAKRLLALAPVVYVGVISYEIYLIHFPFVWVLANRQQPTAVSIPITVLGTAVGAVLLHHLATRPVLARREAWTARSARSPRASDMEPETPR
jgi:peptidoglycan/LPS O-acetylase OafA/YrhL